MSYADIEKRRAYHRNYRKRQRKAGIAVEDYDHFKQMRATYTPEQRREKLHRRRVRNRVRALLVLGCRCRMCGESDVRLLTFNHTNGQTERIAQDKLYTQIKNQERTDIEVLCYNCQVLYEWERGGKNFPASYKDKLRKELADHKIKQDW